MFRKSERDGYVMIDHRDSPGFSGAVAAEAGRLGMPVGPGQMFEAATKTCSHCERVVVMNPERVRKRHECPKCDHYICDGCAAEMQATGVCRPWKQVLAEAYERAIRAA